MGLNYSKKIFLLFFILLQPAALLAETLTDRGITQATLDNGLKIIVKVDRRAPLFISQLWYGIGSSYEKQPITGISHMLEHMMFKGTKAYKAGEFSRIIASNGGRDNAFTSRDFTAYYQTMHKSKLELAIKLEADRMRNLTFSNNELAKERQVVIEERRMRVDDSSIATAMEKLVIISFAENSPYHSPVIGFQKDIENYKLDDLLSWYERYYAPNNATLVVVGDIDAKKVITLANVYFGDYQKNFNISKNTTSKLIPLKGQSTTFKANVELPFFAVLFHVPTLNTATDKKTVYSLGMLANVVHSLLASSLIRKQQIATDINIRYNLYDKYDTAFIISFVVSSGVDNKTVLNAIQEEIAKIIAQPYLIKDEIKFALAQIKANFIYAQDRISTQAYYLGLFSTIGLDIEDLFAYVDHIQLVNVEDVANSASKYLNFKNMNAVELIPLGVK